MKTLYTLSFGKKGANFIAARRLLPGVCFDRGTMNGDTKESPEVQGIFRKYQHHVSRCIAIATSLTVLVSAVAYKLIPASSLSMTPLNTVTSRVVFTLRWNALTVAVLPVIITIIGLLRGSSNQQNPLSTVDRDKVEVC